MNQFDPGYSEDALVEQPAIELFEKLGWETYNGFHEFDHTGGSFLGRETKSEVVLIARLRLMLQKLNPDSACQGFSPRLSFVEALAENCNTDCIRFLHDKWGIQSQIY